MLRTDIFRKTILFFTGSLVSNSTFFDVIYLLFRLHLGLSISIQAGWPKLFSNIRDKDKEILELGVPEWFVSQVSELGFKFPSPTFWAYIATYGEFIGGLLLALGLFTRLNALQLTIQFFVIAFIWYEGVEPIVGMYFQQLFFFSYLLIFGHGSGRYSLDRLIFSKEQERATGKI
ncbi:MAG: DoxX family protein [Bacteroidota bacterium]